ncbi:MAG: zinc-ribbon domain-containing protein [Candidatus Thorarchaeota archaeon]
MFCDNCGNSVDDDSVFCSRCGNQLIPQKAPPSNVPRPTRPAMRTRRESQDFLCFGEESGENPYTGGIVLICIGVFLALLFFFPTFPIEYLVPLAFMVFGALIVINARK